MKSVDHPVIGFRAWKTDDRPGHPFLKSIVQDFGWKKTVEAKCMRPLHWHRGPAPAEGCECGLYAFHTLHRATNYSDPRGVTGIVRGWGQLRVHKDGWRAQHAEILAIVEPQFGKTEEHQRAREVARKAAEHYRVPLIPCKGAEALAAEFGSFVPEELRPDTSIYAGTRGLSGRESAVAFVTVAAPLWVCVIVWQIVEQLWRRRRQG